VTLDPDERELLAQLLGVAAVFAVKNSLMSSPSLQ